MGINKREPSSYKQTALGKIPYDWDVKELGELCNIYVGKDLKENNFSQLRTDEFQYPVFSNTVENEGLYGYYNIKEYCGESLTIVGRGAGLGTAFTRKGIFGAIGRLLILFPKENVSAHYITEYVNNKLKIHQESGGIPQLTGEQISSYKIVIPKNDEQKAIAQFLSTWDCAIETTQKLIAQKELRKKWLMQQLLTGKKRLMGFSGEWKDARLGEVAEFINGKAYKQEEFLSKGKYRVLRVGNLFTNNEWYFSDLEMEDDKYLNVGDLMYAWSASFGPRFWSEDKIIYHYHIWKVLPFKVIDKFFLYYFLLFDVDQIMNNKQGGTMFHITKCDMENRLLRFPSIEEQTAIAQVLQTADSEIQILKNKLDKLKEQKKGLMQVLLTGKKRLQYEQ